MSGERSARTWIDPRWDTEPVEVSRHVAALKRAGPLIAAIVVSMTAAVFFLSSLLPETYEAQARIVLDDRPVAFELGDVETVERRLATVRALLTTRRVLATAAARVGESVRIIEDKVSASVDRDANIVRVTGKDSEAARAAAVANAVARSFLALDLAAEQRQLARARVRLTRALALARGTAERRVIREQLSQLSISGSAAGSELVLAEAARPPSNPSSPRPIRNSIFAFFGSVFLAVLAALALGQLAPRVTGARELGSLTGAPIVASVPSRRLRGGRSLADTVYRQLQSSVALQLPSDVRTVLVAGDGPGHAGSPVAVALARALAGDGSRTLVVSADLRRPRVHEILGVRRAPGLSDVLAALRRGEGESTTELLEEAIVGAVAGTRPLDVLPAGGANEHASQLLTLDTAASLFSELERLEYDHVVVEGPALLGAVDGPVLARYTDALFVACQLDRLTPGAASELGDVLARLEKRVVGLVALGVRDGSHSVNVTPWPRESGRVEV